MEFVMSISLCAVVNQPMLPWPHTQRHFLRTSMWSPWIVRGTAFVR